MEPYVQVTMGDDRHARPAAGPAPAESAVATTLPQAVDECVDVLARAFAGDPCVRWLFPASGEYREHFGAFARAFGGNAFDAGTATRIGRQAVALWLPPGTDADGEALVALVERAVGAPRRDEALGVLERMGELHPRQPHMYLPLLGVDPAVQGRGLGSVLLRHTLAWCDARRLPAYLEATSGRSVPLYRRHGFVVRQVLRSATCPPIVTMVRPPAS